MKPEEFNFDSMEDMLTWYFSTVEDIIQDKYKNAFNRTTLIRVVRGIEIGVKENIKRYEDDNSKTKVCKNKVR